MNSGAGLIWDSLSIYRGPCYLGAHNDGGEDDEQYITSYVLDDDNKDDEQHITSYALHDANDDDNDNGDDDDDVNAHKDDADDFNNENNTKHAKWLNKFIHHK